MISHSVRPNFFVPTKVLLHFQDLHSALLSENLRGHRVAARFAMGMSLSPGTERRTIYDTQQSRKLPGRLVRGEGAPPTADTAVNQAYDSAGATYEFYMEILKRNSVDGKGLRLDSTVHYGAQFNNAFWNGQQMVYGDGDGKLFVGFTNSIDVIAHELTHGVTQYTVPGGLDYEDQSGALNESLSDVFGSVVKQWKNNQTVDQADWLIGAGIMAPSAGNALRSMKDPGNTSLTWPGDDQPKDMSGYQPLGDVHTNSGIPNRAFYLACMNLGGRSWEKAAQIWYRAMPLLTSQATFQEAARATINAATLLGFGKTEQDAVASAWTTVKVL